MSSVDERVAALHDRAQEPLPESWQPEKAGDEIVGTFVRLDNATTSYGPCWIVVLETPMTGELRSVWLFQTALKNQFNKARPKPGELVLVRYEGKRTPKAGGNQYHDYKVVAESSSGGRFTWDDVAGDTPQPDDFVPDDPGPDASYSHSDDDVPF